MQGGVTAVVRKEQHVAATACGQREEGRFECRKACGRDEVVDSEAGAASDKRIDCGSRIDVVVQREADLADERGELGGDAGGETSSVGGEADPKARLLVKALNEGCKAFEDQRFTSSKGHFESAGCIEVAKECECFVGGPGALCGEIA